MKSLATILRIVALFTCGLAFIHNVDVASGQCQANEFTELYASDAEGGNYFGWSVSMSGDVAVVGAWGHDSSHESTFGGSGSAYVFRLIDGAWEQEAELVADEPELSAHFGNSVSIDGDVLVVGAHKEDSVFDNSGSAYVFRFDGQSWNLEHELLPDADTVTDDMFGESVSIRGNVIVVGAHQDDDRGIDAGAAYVFQFDGIQWNQTAKLFGSQQYHDEDDWFGRSVAVDADAEVIVIGAWNDEAEPFRGSAYVFRLGGGGQWEEEDRLVAFDPSQGDFFGHGVSISGDTIVVGTYWESGTGSAYVFVRQGNEWGDPARLTASDSRQGTLSGVPFR